MTAPARVRIGMTLTDAEALSRVLLDAPPAAAERLHDQLWLRTVLIEQRRRTRRAERAAFDARADRILQQLDPDLAGEGIASEPRRSTSSANGSQGQADAPSLAEVES